MAYDMPKREPQERNSLLTSFYTFADSTFFVLLKHYATICIDLRVIICFVCCWHHIICIPETIKNGSETCLMVGKSSVQYSSICQSKRKTSSNYVCIFYVVRNSLICTGKKVLVRKLFLIIFYYDCIYLFSSHY